MMALAAILCRYPQQTIEKIRLSFLNSHRPWRLIVVPLTDRSTVPDSSTLTGAKEKNAGRLPRPRKQERRDADGDCSP